MPFISTKPQNAMINTKESSCPWNRSTKQSIKSKKSRNAKAKHRKKTLFNKMDLLYNDFLCFTGRIRASFLCSPCFFLHLDSFYKIKAKIKNYKNNMQKSNIGTMCQQKLTTDNQNKATVTSFFEISSDKGF